MKLTLEKHEFMILKSIVEDRLSKLEDIISKNSDKLDEYDSDIKNYKTYDIHRKLMQTTTKSLDQWLEECPNKLEFYSRFIDVKEDIELVIKDEKLEVDDDTKEIVLKRYMNQDWSENNEFISYLITDVQVGN